MKRDSQFILWPAALLCALLSSACQPTPDERLARAEEYLAAADYRTATIELQNLLQVTPDNAEARILLAQTAYQLGDFAGSTGQYERALDLGKDDAATWVAYGRALLSQGRAEDVFERVVPNLDLQQEDPDLLVFLGDVQFSLGNLERAGKFYDDAVSLQPFNTGGLIGQAMILANEGDREEAGRLLDTATEHNPESTSVWLARGRILGTGRKYSEAAEAFATAIRLQTPRTPLAEEFSARVSLVLSLIDSRQLELAATELGELKARFPDHPISIFLEGHLAFNNGEFDKAQMAMQDYLSRNSADARGRAVLGAINFSQDNLRQAESNLIAAVRANAGGDATRRLLAETRLRLDNPSGALDLLLSADDMGTTDAVYLSMLGRAQLAAGDDEAALEYFRKGVELEPDSDTAVLALASTYLKVNQTSEAVDLLDSMPARTGSDLRRRTLLIAALVRQGDNERAISESNELIEENPDDPSVHVIAGGMWQSIGASKRAEVAFERVLRLDPDNLSAQFSLSRIALANGETTAAALRLGALLESHPSYVPAIVALGMIFQENGSLESLRPYVLRALENAPESVTPHIILARLELTLGRPDAVLAVVEEAQPRFSGAPELDHFRGLALLAKGENQSALRALMSASSASPENAVFQFDVAQAQLVNNYFDAAMQSAEALCQLLPGDVRCLLLKGDIELAQGNAARAAEYFESASSSSWNRQVAMRMARAYSLAKRGDAAVPLARWLDEHPDDHRVRSFYARVLESLGDAGAAVAEYEKLLAIDALDPAGMNNLAWYYALQNDERAVEIAERAHELAPGNGSITDTLGWILALNGDADRAVPLLREAIEQLPGNSEVRFHLASALADSGEEEEAKAILVDLLAQDEQFRSRADAQQVLDAL